MKNWILREFRYIRNSWIDMLDKSKPPSQWGVFASFGLFFFRRREVEWQLSFREAYGVEEDYQYGDFILWRSVYYQDDKYDLATDHEEYLRSTNEDIHMDANILNDKEEERLSRFKKELEKMNRPLWRKQPIYSLVYTGKIFKLFLEWMTTYWKGTVATVLLIVLAATFFGVVQRDFLDLIITIFSGK